MNIDAICLYRNVPYTYGLFREDPVLTTLTLFFLSITHFILTITIFLPVSMITCRLGNSCGNHYGTVLYIFLHGKARGEFSKIKGYKPDLWHWFIDDIFFLLWTYIIIPFSFSSNGSTAAIQLYLPGSSPPPKLPLLILIISIFPCSLKIPKRYEKCLRGSSSVKGKIPIYTF